jgi:RNA recognition motif-containing protein
LFAEFGTVELVSVPRNRETGQARGFAFVDMATREELDKAIEGVNGLMYGGRTIRAAESLPKNQVDKDSAQKKVVPGTFLFVITSVCLSCIME